MTLNVLGQRVRVTSRKNLRRDENADGQFHIEVSLIEYDKDLSKDERLKTILHELVHAVWYRVGLHTTKASHDLEEIVCEAVSNAVFENLDVIKKLSK